MDVRRAVAALLLLGLLVSCSDDEPSSDPPEPTDSATVSPSPTPTGVANPRTAREAVRAWFQVYNDAVDSGDVANLRRVSARGCITCQGYIESIERTASAGGSVSTSGWKVTRLTTVVEADDGALFTVHVHEPAGTVIRKEGAEPAPFSATNDVFQIYVKKRQGVWIVTTMALVES